MYFERKKIIFTDMQQVTGDRERDALIASMRVVEEREGERRGWDLPPRLYTMHLHHIDSGTMELRPVPQTLWRSVPPMLWGRVESNAVDELLTTALKLRIPPDRNAAPLAFADSPDGIAAIGLLHEGWAATPELLETMSDDMAKRLDAGERVIHQLPGRMEVRFFNAVDINGCGYVLPRVRGNRLADPELYEREDMWPEPGQDGPGRLITALYCLAYAARVSGWPWR